MNEREIIKKWNNGLSKEQLAKMYKQQYNQQIKILRATVKHRHSGKFITNYDALKYIEKIIYKYVISRNSKT